ncbi:MAG: alkane 1-monooxygenase [Pikeienuella sp.]
MPIAAYAFAISFAMPVLIGLAAAYGGWFLAGVPIYGWFVTSFLDRFIGLNTNNADPTTEDTALFWHRVVTWIWVPLQIGAIIGAIYAVSLPNHLHWSEAMALMMGVGIATGGIGITYAHELIHQKNRFERGLGNILLASVCYGPFTTEHLHNHHIYVATPKDPVTARYGEGFWRFFPRAVAGTFGSAWRIDHEQLRRRGYGKLSWRNPWWRYALMSSVFVVLALWVGGSYALLLFFQQCFTAVMQLEAVNYVEHYGLTRKHLGDGKYEPTKPRHSWNGAQHMTNLLLINLQRHSDHHYKPNRRFPLLQTYDESDAPQLPYGYPLMVFAAYFPPVWFRMMNRQVKAWRRQHYPEITDWMPYKKGQTQMPR